MRSVNTTIFFVIAILLLLHFNFHGIECNVNFSVLNASKTTYKNFIAEFRRQLSIGTQKVENITVLKHQVAPNQRFLYVHLTNFDNQRISLGIDVFDVYVLGFLTGNNAYILKDVPPPAYNTSLLFPGSIRTNLSYSGSYPDLTQIGSSRENLPLGLNPLNSAITNMFRPSLSGSSLPNAFIVAIQMVSEAARFKYIETTIANSIDRNVGFLPDPAFTSLQNEWGALSKNIQEAQFNNGNFRFEVVLKTVSGQRLVVTNVSHPVVKGVALMKYHRVGSLTDFHNEMHDVM